MNAADSRTRTKVILEPSNAKTRGSTLPHLVKTNALLVLALGLAKDHLVSTQGDVLRIAFWTLAVGAVGVVARALISGQWRKKAIEWPVVGFASLLQSLRFVALLVALSRMSAIRVAVITQFSSSWMKSVLANSTTQPTLLITGGLLFSLIADARFSSSNLWDIAPAYTALGLEALSSSILEHTQGVLLPSLGPSMAHGVTVAGSFVLTTLLYLCSTLLPSLPSASSENPYAMTIIVPLLAYSLLHSSPQLFQQVSLSPSRRDVILSHLFMLASALLYGFLVLSQRPNIFDVAVAGALCYGITLGRDRPAAQSPYASMTKVARGYLKSILENPESRKIFYFLVLNMCYMLVQMLYGIWTNSLGLISDAIHMAFDCMAIGVGLIASVMARWAPNERFTYGYGRIETLSGFSNGIFLILISIFIVFEAIERLIDPPEMNTSQLLLVSTLGLCVNLFGMFAMGGHHHHGGHSHSHGHPHQRSSEIEPDHGHSHGHDHHEETAHSHGASSAGHASDAATLPHTHSHSENQHAHTPSASPEIPHAHSHDQSPSSTHSHSHTNSHVHSHANSHLHSPSSCDHDNAHRTTGTVEDSHDGSIVLTAASLNSIKSPLTPNYNFGHDQHFEEHHAHEHGPNLHNHAHSHDHAHEGHSHNMRGVFLHVMADTLGSVGVILSTLLIQFYGWTGFDPIASLFIAILIAGSVIPLVIDTGKVLMLDTSHHSPSISGALSSLHHVEGLDSFSSARFWPKDDSTMIGSIHLHISSSLVHVDPGGPHTITRGKYSRVDRIVERVDTVLRSSISGLEELTIQVEPS